MIARRWCRWYKMIDLSDESDYRKSIFNLFNHLQSSQQNETETNKTALKYTTKKEKTPTFGWSHVDDADDTDHPDRRVTDGQTDGRLTSSIFGDHSTQKALKGKKVYKIRGGGYLRIIMGWVDQFSVKNPTARCAWTRGKLISRISPSKFKG